MAPERDGSVPSDNEGAEKPVREQLKKAHIAPQHSGEHVADSALDAHGEGNGDTQDQTQPRGSIESDRDHVLSDADAPATRQHTRKRSRDSTVEEDKINNGQRKVSGERSRDGIAAAAELMTEHTGANGVPEKASQERPATPEASGEKRTESAVEGLMSPKSKRSRLQSSDNGDANHPAGAETVVDADIDKEGSVDVGHVTKAKVPAQSGFANTSAESPFGALSGSKSPSVDPSPASAQSFASSGFGKLSGAQSGFGVIGKQSGGFGTGGGFATRAQEKSEATKSPPGSTFGGALGQKSAFGGSSIKPGGFGSSISGFGTLGQSSGGGFGSGSGFGGGGGFGGLGSTGGLKSFASEKPNALVGASAKPSKAFGASGDDDEEGDDGAEEDDSAGIKTPLASAEEDKQDERFYEQDVETGEEHEVIKYSCRAKLYNFATLADNKREWRERGLGVLRLNLQKGPDGDPVNPPKARFLMRADGSHRVVLNTPIQKELKFGDPNGKAPQGGYMYFMGTIEGASKLELLQLKMRPQFALEIYDIITALQAEM